MSSSPPCTGAQLELGYRGLLKKVHVKPGHSASADAEWSHVTRTSATCRLTAGFAFTPAGTSRTVYRTVRDVSVCSLEVQPTVPGRTGASSAETGRRQGPGRCPDVPVALIFATSVD